LRSVKPRWSVQPLAKLVFNYAVLSTKMHHDFINSLFASLYSFITACYVLFGKGLTIIARVFCGEIETCNHQGQSHNRSSVPYVDSLPFDIGEIGIAVLLPILIKDNVQISLRQCEIIRGDVPFQISDPVIALPVVPDSRIHHQ